jgi:flagellar hook assembly protein FlgD
MVTAVSGDIPPLEAFSLGRGFPNPFNNTVEMRIELPLTSHVVAEIYDVRGRFQAVLADRQMTAGIHTIAWDGRDSRGLEVPPGHYFCRVRAGGNSRFQKVVLVR